MNLNLVRDNNARNRAITRPGAVIQAGNVVLRVPAFVTALLPKSKGKRCDSCCRTRDVKACSKCREVFYCDTECQRRAWKSHHRKVCGYLSKGFHLSPAYLAQDSEHQANADLLLNLYGQMSTTELPSAQEWDQLKDSEPDLSMLSQDPAKCFMDFISHPNPRPVPVLPPSLGDHREFLQNAWSRFDCNNFVLHTISALEPESGSYALGVFPLASRCFNHSCAPNAWCAFVLQERQAWLEVRALQTIEPGQEITIPYLDPALTFTERQARLRHTYNFTCTCSKCTIEKPLRHPPAPPSDTSGIEGTLIVLVFGRSPSSLEISNAGFSILSQLPASLGCIRHEDFMKNLSKRFEDETHDGPYNAAWITGRALLALCLLLYPRNYPLTAYYALELAKACWNALTTEESSPPNLTWIECVGSVLDFAEPILQIIGSEEEESVATGLTTCKTLRELAESEK